MGDHELRRRIEDVLGSRIIETGRLAVGFGLTGLALRLADGRHLAVKAQQRAGADRNSLELEAYMLSELAQLSELPVPHVHYADADLLVMDFIENDGGGITPSIERHAGELIARLHATKRDRFGYARDTLIGPLPQPNPPASSWVPFFRDHRLLFMAEKAHEEGSLPSPLYARIERLADLVEPVFPSLLHGDLWTGNVLVRGGRIGGFVDPAIYCGHPEIELAFTTMFGTFGQAFFEAYEAHMPLAPGFHEAALRPLQPLPDARPCQVVRIWLSCWNRPDPRQARPIATDIKRTGPDGAGPVFPAKRAELQRHGLYCGLGSPPHFVPEPCASEFFPSKLCRSVGN